MLTKQTVPKSDLIKIIQNYNLGIVKTVQPIATSGNISFLIKTSFGKYFLRICPEGHRWRSQEEIASELELIDYLNNHKFPAPEPVTDKKGNFIIEYKNKYGYLREYNHGQEVLNPNIKQVIEFGRILGWYHKLVEGYKTKHKREHFWDLGTTQKNFAGDKKVILKSNFPKANKFVAELEKQLFSLSFSKDLPRGMIHEDLGKRHVLWQNNKITCIVDFDRTYYGYLILDLGQALRGWCFVDDWQKWSNENFKALLNGYSQKRKLISLEKEYLLRAIKFSILERAISFALRFGSTQDNEDADFAWRSVTKFLKMLDENKRELEAILQ